MNQKKLKMNDNAFDFLVVGLGNPTKEYENTRHNVGFCVVDVLLRDCSPYWKKECGALTSRFSCHDKHLLIAKPQSYMNTSGGPVFKLAKKYGIPNENIIVVHDDLDLEPGNIRVKFGGGLAGHNGLKSIAEKLNSKNFFRIKIGIGHPQGKMSVIDFVLSTPRGAMFKNFEESIIVGKDALLCLINYGLDVSQNKFNRKQQ